MSVFRRFGDCESDLKGTGSGKCDLRTMKDPRGIIFFQKGWSLTPQATLAATLNEQIYKTQLATLQAFPFIEIHNFEQNTPENEKNTSSIGVLTEVRAGKPQFSFMYDRGLCFQKALFDKRGKNRWDLGIIFESGILLASNEDDTKIVGFDMGMVSVETYKFVQGTDPEMSTVTIQLLDAEQFNNKGEFFTWKALGFNMNRIDGVIDAELSYNVVPATGTTVQVKVTGGCNTEEFLPGFDSVGNWRLGGTQSTTTAITGVAYAAATGVYTLTLDNALAANDTIQPELFNVANTQSVVEDAAGNQFKGEAPLATIA